MNKIKLWKVVVFPDNQVSAVPCSWLIKINGKLMCFWPEKNSRTKIEKNECLGDDKYKLHECRVLMKDATYTNFKEALAMEILAQDVSFVEITDSEDDDGSSSSKKLKLSEGNDKFEFVKSKKEVDLIESAKGVGALQAEDTNGQCESELSEVCAFESVVVVHTSLQTEPAAGQPEREIVLNENVGEKTSSPIPPICLNSQLVTRKDDEIEAFESTSTSEKLKLIFMNQIAEKKVYIELSNRLASVENHIKKYGGGAYSRALEELTLQVKSVEMFAKLEKELEVATKTALAENFNKTIFEKDIKQYVKILLLRFFDDEFFAHNVTGKSGDNVVLNKSRTLSCIYESIEKKFQKKRIDVEDTVFRAIDQLKDALRKKYPKPKKTVKKPIIQTELPQIDDPEDKPDEAENNTGLI